MRPLTALRGERGTGEGAAGAVRRHPRDRRWSRVAIVFDCG